MSVSLLIFFSKLELKQKQKKMITKFAPYTFGVYLIHDHPLIRANLMNNRFAFIINHFSLFVTCDFLDVSPVSIYSYITQSGNTDIDKYCAILRRNSRQTAVCCGFLGGFYVRWILQNN